MRVFVAGAAGTIGRRVVRRLVASGHLVHGLTRGRSNAPLIESLGARAVIAEARNGEALWDAVREARPEGVIDVLTSFPRGGPTRYSHFRATNELRERVTPNLLEAAIRAGARRYVAESVVFAYGWTDRGPGLLTESDPVALPSHAPPRLRPALRAVLTKERMVLEASAEGIEGVVARYGGFYGPDVGTTELMIRLLRSGMLFLPGGGAAVVSWIHIEDAAAATIAAVERGRPGTVYNIVDDEPVSVREFADELARVLRTGPPRSVPRWLAAPFAPYAARFLSRGRLRVSNALAKSELRWRPAIPGYREGVAGLAHGRRGQRPPERDEAGLQEQRDG